MVQQARSALARSEELMLEALNSHPDRSEEKDAEIAKVLKEQLIDLPQEHGAAFDATDAFNAGLPVTQADPDGDQWRIVWRLWTKYFALNSCVYEGRLASQVHPPAPPY
jgi:hypothetical protein